MVVEPWNDRFIAPARSLVIDSYNVIDHRAGGIAKDTPNFPRDTPNYVIQEIM